MFSLSLFDVIFILCYAMGMMLYALKTHKVPDSDYFQIIIVSLPIVLVICFIFVAIGRGIGAVLRLMFYSIKRKRTPVNKRIKEIRFTDKLECVGDDVENFYSYQDLSKIIIGRGTMAFFMKRKPILLLDASEFIDFTVEDIIRLIQTHNPSIEVLYSGKFWRKTLFF
ncbi:hypothetical protein NHG29_08210 [Aerococcaceae bacterium NML160702]|nr:hypothetical protein [Aerococcaceae bacterium NML171108]MCW6680068.1 hypothetical protein [Aerococcaceae bacterium NML130460]MCW6682860.1 hypothetical protein [Aerococcaceae bacterium NML160702]